MSIHSMSQSNKAVQLIGHEGQVVDLEKGSHVHLIGICGTAMASLAGLLQDMGFHVTGSDQNIYPPMSTQLERFKIKCLQGYQAEHVNPRPDFVIIGNVISRQNPEAAEVLKLKIPYASLPQAIGQIVIQDRDSFVVSGTHGKTTTTSLLAWTLDQCGTEPGFLIGGIPVNYGQSFQLPKKNTFAIEGDEYDTAFFDKVPKFIHYRPKFSILTSVEFDHADIYRDLDHVMEAFEMLLARIPDDGLLVACGDDENVRKLCGQKKRTFPILFYGEDSKNDAVISGCEFKDEGCFFDLKLKDKIYSQIQVSIFGRYNILNAAAVFTMLIQRGQPEDKIRSAFKSFRGVKRRQEILGEPAGRLVIEDFAHHPTAIKATLRGIRERYPKRRILAAFEPRSATSRRAIFQQSFAESFADADQVFLSEVFNKEALAEEGALNIDQLTNQIEKTGTRASHFSSADQIVEKIKQSSCVGDVIVIMSNGAFGGIYQKVLSALASS